MKRIQMSKKVNRNNTLFNHRIPAHINTVTPEILVGQIWLQEDEPTAVEIIELNSSDEYDPSPDERPNNNLDHAWSYINNDRLQQLEDNYKINKKARERWRQNHENQFNSTNTATNTDNNLINQFYSDIAGNHRDDNDLINHKVNCFTIINKHFTNSDSSTEEDFADVEIITSKDMAMEPTNKEIITDLDKETRTIWIYSFKNKHLLSEDDYEPTNIAARDLCSSTSSSIETDDELTKVRSTNVRRIGSPIPPAYIPRLNLAPTLSTVTEVSEPIMKHASSNGSNKSSMFQKPKNGWFLNEHEKFDDGLSISKREKTTNIVNWMALSPRERRRRPKHDDRWEGTVLNLESPKIANISADEKQKADESPQDKPFRLQVDVDVHVSVNDKSPDKRSTGTPTNVEVRMKSKKDEPSPLNKLKCMDTLLECVKDRGDHEIKFENNHQILCNTLPPYVEPQRFVMVNHINDEFEDDAVDQRPPRTSAEWHRETQEESQTADYDYETGNVHIGEHKHAHMDSNIPDHVWEHNAKPCLKPAEWYAYAPERTSLSLRLSVASVPELRRPWYRRLIKWLTCCK
ncbi:unnamed protein product [Chrysodeixis includens]|uniref:Uncharacterized protein n=1 Tax=Chrysodeixis includens TaxID=689277 RepID=A0A9P0BNL5_CHRIL|nr:unnamed protein product [Chrysodeixis includens]